MVDLGDYEDNITVMRIHLGTGETSTSNYGAADIFVLDVFGENTFPSTVVRLDTTAIPAALSFDGRTLNFEDITSGTKAIDIEGMPLQGLEVYAVGPNGKWQEI